MIDCRSLETQPTPVPKDVAVIIVNSNVPHDLVTGEYNTRRWQCEKAAEFFGVKALRDRVSRRIPKKRSRIDRT